MSLWLALALEISIGKEEVFTADCCLRVNKTMTIQTIHTMQCHAAMACAQCNNLGEASFLVPCVAHMEELADARGEAVAEGTRLHTEKILFLKLHQQPEHASRHYKQFLPESCNCRLGGIAAVGDVVHLSYVDGTLSSAD
eukprot:413303-Amphidinium_carterae.1